MSAAAIGWVALGGALGALGRYGVGLGVARLGAPAWSATIGVNLIGSFLLGLALGAPAWSRWRSAEVRAGVTSGLLGALTTFATFEADAGALWRASSALHSLLYVVSSVVGGAACFALGWWAARAASGEV